MINYRKGSKKLREAWFAYKKLHRHTTLSVVSFAAGWNAAMYYSSLQHAAENMRKKISTIKTNKGE